MAIPTTQAAWLAPCILSQVKAQRLHSRLAPGPWSHSPAPSPSPSPCYSLSLLRVIPDDPLGDAAGFGGAFALDRDVPDDLVPLVDLLECARGDSRADARAGRHRRDEPDAVEAVIDRQPQAGEAKGVADECAHQRQGQEPVRDGGPERRLHGRARFVDVNPLLIASRVGELIDAGLRDFEPLADGDLLADAVAQRAYVQSEHIVRSRGQGDPFLAAPACAFAPTATRQPRGGSLGFQRAGTGNSRSRPP